MRFNFVHLLLTVVNLVAVDCLGVLVFKVSHCVWTELLNSCLL